MSDFHLKIESTSTSNRSTISECSLDNKKDEMQVDNFALKLVKLGRCPRASYYSKLMCKGLLS